MSNRISNRIEDKNTKFMKENGFCTSPEIPIPRSLFSTSLTLRPFRMWKGKK